MKSPFHDAIIKRFDALPSHYGAETAKRGTPEFYVRAHVLTEIKRNARRWVLGYESPESKSKLYGELLDCLALTPKQWPVRFTTCPATYTNKDGEVKPWRNDKRIPAIAEWLEANEGREIVDAETNGSVHAALERLRGDDRIKSLLDCSKAQCWIEAKYTDRTTGLTVPVKCLIDLVPFKDDPLFGMSLADLKTTRNASPRRFARDAFEYGYDIAAALYLDLFNAATGEDRNQFLHIVQENYPPYECRLPVMADRFVNRGRLVYQSVLELYCRCVCSGYWPSYDEGDNWPITEPEEWMLEQSLIYQPLIEPEPEAEETADVIP